MLNSKPQDGAGQAPKERAGKTPPIWGDLHLPLRSTLFAILATLIFAVLFAETYGLLNQLVPTPWIAAALIHTIFAAAFFLAVLSRPFPSYRSLFLLPSSLVWYLPALIILGGSLLIAFGTGVFSDEPQGKIVFDKQWAWIFWIPLVEEIVFRGFLGEKFRKKFGLIWGVWFAALLFALVHSNPTLERVMALDIGIPLGPFLLGIVAEILLIKSRSLWPCIAFHAACNATVFVFMYLDERWIKWLELLYI